MVISEIHKFAKHQAGQNSNVMYRWAASYDYKKALGEERLHEIKIIVDDEIRRFEEKKRSERLKSSERAI